MTFEPRISLAERTGQARWTLARRRREALTLLIPVAAVALSALVYLYMTAGDGLPQAMAAHAALMLAAWVVLLPAGAIIARYGKVTADQDFPREVDNPYWWNWHRILQYAGIAVATAAYVLIVQQTRAHFVTWHGRIGFVVLILGWSQIIAGWLRGTKGGPTDKAADPARPETWRGDHFDMSLRRRLFEHWHKTFGWIAVILSTLVILLGADLVDLPAWLLLTIGALQGSVVLACVDGAVRRRWVDTYRALWGGDAPLRHTTEARSDQPQQMRAGE